MNFSRPINVPLPITGPLDPWGNAVTLNIGGDQRLENLVDLSSAILRLRLRVTNGVPPAVPGNYIICKPAISWIKTYSFAPTFKSENGKSITIRYPGSQGRGDAGFIYTIMDRSAANYNQFSYVEKDFDGVNQNTTNFEVDIPFRYLLDPACTKRFLPISYWTLSLTFDSFYNIFSPPAQAPANFAITVPNWTLSIDTYNTISIPQELMYPDPRLTFVTYEQKGANDLSINTTITVSGKLLRIFYFMVQENTSAAGGGAPNPYSFCPNVNSVITYHQLTGMGHTYPLIPDYSVNFQDGVNEQGLNRHYREFTRAINKDQPSANCAITYQMWKAQYRIYSIDVNDNDMTYHTVLNFNAQLNVAMGVPYSLYIVQQYLPPPNQVRE